MTRSLYWKLFELKQACRKMQNKGKTLQLIYCRIKMVCLLWRNIILKLVT